MFPTLDLPTALPRMLPALLMTLLLFGCGQPGYSPTYSSSAAAPPHRPPPEICAAEISALMQQEQALLLLADSARYPSAAIELINVQNKRERLERQCW